MYFIFDLLHLDGDDVGALPLIERKARLAALLSGVVPPLGFRAQDPIQPASPASGVDRTKSGAVWWSSPTGPEIRFRIGLQKAREVREMGRWMLAAAVGAVEVDRRRRRGATERPVVADIDP